MPVKFQSSSGYKTKFATQPIQMKKYAPSPTAGVSSELARTVMEPPLQRKKRVEGPPQCNVPLTDAQLLRNGEDYYLLGANDKFVNNIRYRAKSMDRDYRKNKPSEDKENTRNGHATELTPPPAPRPINPPPKVRYDTGAPVIKTKKPISKAVEIQVNGAEPVTTQATQSRKSRSPKRKETVDEGKPAKAQKKASDHRVKVSAPKPEEVMKEKRQPEQAPSDYAIKYKHGVAPPRVKGPKRLSEYAMQYKWKDGVKSSPVLAAEQIVYKSNPAVAPFKAKMVKESEYNRAFKSYKMMQSTPNLLAAAQKEEKPSKGKPKVKRTRSLEDLTPDQMPAAGTHKLTEDEDKRMLKGSMNPQKLFFPHGKSKKLRSQYAVNYKAPQRYDYVDGAWVGAAPPHLEPKVDSDSGQDVTDGATNWFAEVVELRRKADEYKKRAQGTHFSREHTGQLFAKQNQVWDTVSESGSIVSALSLETASGSRVSSRMSDASSRLSSARGGSRASQASTTPRALSPSISDDGTLVEDFDDDDGGRIPTPKLRQQKVQVSTRHHLDRTTPTSGGALLTSPPHGVMTPSEDSSWADVAKQGTRPRKSTSAPAIQAKKSRPPTYGMPTRDSHALLDEDASTDRTLPMQFVHSPPKQDKLGTIREDMGATFNPRKPMNAWEVKLDEIPRRNVEDDILSTSARSVASSCSLASEVLERAKKNRDKFWKE